VLQRNRMQHAAQNSAAVGCRGTSYCRTVPHAQRVTRVCRWAERSRPPWLPARRRRRQARPAAPAAALPPWPRLPSAGTRSWRRGPPAHTAQALRSVHLNDAITFIELRFLFLPSFILCNGWWHADALVAQHKRCAWRRRGDPMQATAVRRGQDGLQHPRTCLTRTHLGCLWARGVAALAAQADMLPHGLLVRVDCAP